MLRQHGPLAAAIALALLAWALQALWIAWDAGPPESDEWHHLTKAEFLLRNLQNRGLAGMLDSVVYLRSTFPPLVHLGAVPAFLLHGDFSTDAAALSLGPWLALLVLASYGVGRETVGRTGGLAAACMVAGYPLVVSLSRKYLLDLTLASLVAATLWALLRSRGLSRPGWAWLSGALFGLALLSKFIAGVFLLGAYLWLAVPPAIAAARRWPVRAALGGVALAVVLALVGLELSHWVDDLLTQARVPGSWLMHHLTHDQPPRLSWSWHLVGVASAGLWYGARRAPAGPPRQLLGLAAATAAAVWVAGCWYVAHMYEVVRLVPGFSSAGGVGEGDPSPTTLAGWLFYPWALGRAMPRAWFHLLAVGLVAGLVHRDLRRRLGPLLASIAVAYVVVNLSHNKEVRYTLALACPMAVVAVGWARILPRLPRALLWGTVAAMALAFMTSWVAVYRGWWEAPPDLVWTEDRVKSSGRGTLTGHWFPDDPGPADVLQTPDFYVVAPLPRDLPWSDDELPFGYIGP